MLTACSPTGGPGKPSGPGGADAAATGPSPLLTTACADLVPLDLVKAALGDGVEPDEFPLEAGGTWSLSRIGLLQAGALHCHWSGAAHQAGPYPANLEITALADAAEHWTTWASELGAWAPATELGDAGFGTCESSLRGSYHYCFQDLLVAGTWVYIKVDNLVDTAAADPIVQAVVGALAGAQTRAATWSPAAGAITLPSTCAAMLTAEQVGAAVATEGIAEREAPLLMPVLFNAGVDAALDCSWSNAYTSAVPMPIGVTVLPGAGWAWESEWAKPRPARSPAVAVAGLGDAAFSGCTTDESNVCFVDVLADGAWLAVSGNKQAGVAGLTTVAQEALDSLGYSG